MTRPEQLADEWLAHDRAHARDAREAAAMDASRAARLCIVELWLEHAGASSDGLGGFAQLGRILADEHVSCASALACVSSFARILPAPDDTSLAAARSALADAFVDTRVEHERRDARERAELAFVEVSPGCAAVVASPPDDDAEWLQEWADRLAAAMLRRGVRHVVVQAPTAAHAALAASLALVGIDVVQRLPLTRGAEPAQTRGWRRLFGW